MGFEVKKRKFQEKNHHRDKKVLKTIDIIDNIWYDSTNTNAVIILL